MIIIQSGKVHCYTSILEITSQMMTTAKEKNCQEHHEDELWRRLK